MRGASHGFIALQIAVKDVGALMMMSWPILRQYEWWDRHCVSEVQREKWCGGRGSVRFGVVVLRDVEEAPRNRLEGPKLGESEAL